MIVKKFKFISPKIPDKRGIEFGYDEHGRLAYIHIKADIDDAQDNFFFGKVPAKIQGLKAFQEMSETIKIIEIPFDLSFETFWFTYYDRADRKAGHKTRCEKKWNKLKEITKIKALDYIEVYKQWLRQNPNIAKKYAETYLEHKEWENE